MRRIGDGAEAIIYRDGNSVIKDRIKKRYRLDEIDTKLRKFRTRREAKVIDKLNAIGFPSPKLMESDDKKALIKMSFVKGTPLRDVLDDMNPEEIGREIGRKIALLHKNNIIHGDLTTSNMIWDDEVYFIDFGLSFFSTKIEDMAVDLHLLKEALESKHFRIWERCYKSALGSYTKEMENSEAILNRLVKVEARGRYKKAKKKGNKKK